MSFQLRPRFVRSGPPVLGGIALLLLAAATGAQSVEEVEEVEQLPLSAAPNAALNAVVLLSGDHPEPEWNRIDIVVAGHALRCLIPNYAQGEVAATRRILELAKVLVPDTVLASTGPIGTSYSLGEIYGIEFDIFPQDPAVKPVQGERLPLLGLLRGLNPQGVVANLGNVYLYDETLFEQRLADLAAGQQASVPLDERMLWLDSVVWANATNIEALNLSGISNRIEGGLSSNGSIRVGGESHVFLDPVLYSGSYVQVGPLHQVGPLAAVPVRPAPEAPHGSAWYRGLAEDADQDFTGSVTITAGLNQMPLANGQPVSGVVYATGPIVVSGAVRGTLTLVSETRVEFGVGASELTAAVDEVLALVVGNGSIHVATCAGSLTGSLLARGGSVAIVGSSSLILGQVVADTVSVTGGGNLLSDGTH